MKRIVTILMCCLAVICAQADTYTTTSNITKIEEQPRVRIPLKFEFYGKVGLNIMSIPEDHSAAVNETKSKVGFDFDLGFMSHFRPSNPSKFYWGGELGFTQVGGEIVGWLSPISVSDYAVVISPSVGWKKEIFDNISLDLHFNPGVLYKFKDLKFSRRLDTNANCSLKGGIGIWYKRLNLDFSYRRVNIFNRHYIDYSNILISLGYRF